VRVFVFCVDALEYNFVKDRPYPNLKQKHFYKVDIPREAMSITESGRITPYTPVIWEIIFTGKIKQTKPEPKSEVVHWNNQFMNWINSKKSVKSTYNFLVRKGFVKAGLPERIGFKRKDILQDKETFVSKSIKPIIIHNPLKADIKWAGIPLHRTYYPFSKIAESRVEVFNKEMQETLDQLDYDWDLFVVYTKLLDVIGHLFWKLDEKVETYYQMVDDFAGKIREALYDEDVMVILSDHGMRSEEETIKQGGQHSYHLFASFSHNVDEFLPLTITYFNKIIGGFLQQGLKDKEIIMKRLKELGYI